MSSNQYQSGMFENKTDVLQLRDAEVEYQREFYSNEAAQRIFTQILNDTQWRQDTITVYGKQHLTPRLSYWVGEDWMDYSYSNHTMKANAWSQCLLDIKERIEQQTGDLFNSVLLNYYRDGQDSNGWHSDDEPELGEQPTIASLSLGGARDFQMRKKDDKTQKCVIKLEHGSLLTMRGRTQSHWQHQIPKRAQTAGFRQTVYPSYSIVTFRQNRAP